MHFSLEKALRDLLLERLLKEHSVEIPKIGTFSLHHRAPEKIVSKNNGHGGKGSGKTTFITPPVNEIQFRLGDVKIAGDGASELSFRSGLSIPEIEKELSALRRKLDESSSSKPVALESIGVFAKNSSREIEFTPHAKLLAVLNFQYSGLGNVEVLQVDVLEASSEAKLSDQSVQPAKTTQPEKPSSQKPVQSHKQRRTSSPSNWVIPAGFAFVLILLAGAYFLFLNPVQTEVATQTAPLPVTQQAQDESLPTQQAQESPRQAQQDLSQTDPAQPLQAQSVPAQSETASLYGLFGDFNEELRGSFAISVFSFSDIDNASEQAAVLLSEGYRMHIRTLWRGESTTWQLTIGQFESREEAEKALQTLSSTVFPEPEILQLP